MTNVWVMYGPYSKEKNHYLFGYTYIPKDNPVEEKNPEAKSVQPKRELYKGFVFREANK